MTTKVLIHCKPELTNYLIDNGFNPQFSKQFGSEELDVIVDDVPYEVVDGFYQDPDEQLCEHYGIDYDLVNCIEAM